MSLFTYEAMFDKILHSTSTCLESHEVLSSHHLALLARQEVCNSAIAHYRRELLAFQATLVQHVQDSAANSARVEDQLHKSEAQLQDLLPKHNKLAAQVNAEDPLIRALYDLYIADRHRYHGDYDTPRLPPDCQSLLEQLFNRRPYLHLPGWSPFC